MRLFDRFATTATRWTGSPYAFGCAVLTIVVWLIAGPIFRYSDAWQLVVNTGTTIITFLMVFLLQQSQNKDSVAVHLKLDELLSSQHAASNALIGIENASEEELRRLAAVYLKLASERQTAAAGGEAGAGGPQRDDVRAAGREEGEERGRGRDA
jgi:low affinity Fe/Cu permease